MFHSLTRVGIAGATIIATTALALGVPATASAAPLAAPTSAPAAIEPCSVEAAIVAAWIRYPLSPEQAERVAERRIRIITRMPDELRADLKGYVALPRGEARRELGAEIATTALDGGYGERTQRIAEVIEERVAERCGD